MNKIEIEVKINGEVARLSDVSDETLAKIKKAETAPIKHGDYGYHIADKEQPRLFVEVDGLIGASSKNGDLQVHNANTPLHRDWYIITGNIFEDMKNKA